MFDKLFSKAPYNLIIKTVKLFGFVFFSLDTSAGRLKFYRNRVDYFAIVVSLTFSFLIVSTVFYNDEPPMVKSIILAMGIIFMWNLTIISSLVMKISNIFGARTSFEGLKSLSRIDVQASSFYVNFLDFL
jgi:hypothetical protein